MDHPIIILTPQYNEDRSRMTSPRRYTDRMTERGAIPLISPIIADEEEISRLISISDGVLFTGGDDVDPELYGREKEPECGFVTRYRDDFEIALLKAAMAAEKPVFGICRGIQIMNAALGGTLVQHKPGHQGTTHGVRVEKGSLLHSILGSDAVKTNSFHHQHVDSPFPGGRITAWADDGTPEALETDYSPFFLGVQWHPEVRSGEEFDGWSDVLLSAFVDACRENMRR